MIRRAITRVLANGTAIIINLGWTFLCVLLVKKLKKTVCFLVFYYTNYVGWLLQKTE